MESIEFNFFLFVHSIWKLNSQLRKKLKHVHECENAKRIVYLKFFFFAVVALSLNIGFAL